MALAQSPMVTVATSDNNAEVGSVSFRIDVALDYAGPKLSIRNAVMATVNGLEKENGVYDRFTDDLRLLGPQTSDKGHKWRVTYRDNVTGRLESKTIPTANPLLRKTGSDEMDPLNAAYTGLKTAIETNVRHSQTGNAVTLESVIYES